MPALHYIFNYILVLFDIVFLVSDRESSMINVFLFKPTDMYHQIFKYLFNLYRASNIMIIGD